MLSVAQLAARRVDIIDEMAEIKSMRKGVLNTKYQKVKHKNGEVVEKGPYYELTKKGAGGKTIAQSVPAKDAERIKAEVDSYKRFRQLSDEYVDVCEQMSLLADCDDEGKKTKHPLGIRGRNIPIRVDRVKKDGGGGSGVGPRD